MKHHVLTKTVALLLCAVFLLGAVGSAAGILVMTELGLYNRGYQTAYNEMVESWADGLAYNIGYRYFSGALGNCPTQLLDHELGTNGYYDIFDMSKVGYEVKDASGEVLQSQPLDPGSTPEYTFTFPIRGSYMHLVESLPYEQWEQQQNAAIENSVLTVPADGEIFLYDAVPPEGAEVYHMTMSFLDGNSEGVGSDEALGYIYYDASGWLYCQFYRTDLVDEIVPATVTHIVFADAQNSVLFEASDPAGVGKLWYQQGDLYYVADLAALHAAAAPETSEPSLSSVITGARAVVNRKTPVWTLTDGEFEKQGYYYGKDYDVTIYATKVVDGILYGCTTQGYLTNEVYRSEWVCLDHVTFFQSPAISSGSGMKATCLERTTIWALEDGECFDTGMYYQKGQEIGILVLGSFDSGEWAMTDLGWVHLSSLDLGNTPALADAADGLADIPAAETPAEADSQTYITTAEVNVRTRPDLTADALVLLPPDTSVEVLRMENANGIDWALTREGWIQAEFLEALPVAVDPTEATEVTEAIEEITFTASPIDPTEEMVNLEEVTDGPVTSVETIDPTAETMPETAAAAYREDSEAEPTQATEPVYTKYDITYTQYYDYDTDTRMMGGYVYETAPDGYTVEIQLLPGALRYQWEWTLLELCYGIRSELPKLLGICALGFILLIVYLCCAAAKAPKCSELRPGGLNRLPLDLYALADVGIIAAAAALGIVAFEEFSDKNLNVALGTAASMAYVVSLTVVGCIFAIAAQCKTPGGYWWRNSLCGRSIRLLGRFFRWLAHCGEKLGIFYDEKGEAAIVKFFKSCWKLILFFWNFCVRILKWCYHTLKKGTAWLGNKVIRFFSLLPLTWQWLVTGFVMLLLVAMVFATNGEELLVLICVVGCIAIVLYGAHCFGTLFEGVKRMNKGDLDEKVDDKLLIGSFKDFSDELNGLADVAVIAAQKQLKSERMKTELITNVSHDIKTPLTSIINYVDLMQKPHSDAEQEQYLEVLDRQSQRLKKLIDDLMEMSKASTGNLSVDIGVVNAGEAIHQALGEFADKLERAGLDPVFRKPEKTVEMRADGRLVWRVMSNLLSNAVKYALPGTRLYIDLAQVEDKVIISMKNISREELNVQADELLERFVRGDISRNTEGSGLGLNIAQSLMELQKGQLQLLVDGDLFKVTLIFPGV